MNAQAVKNARDESYKALPAHELNKEELRYLESRTAQEKELHELAVKMLGSSYFVERTHGFRKWLAGQKQEKKN